MQRTKMTRHLVRTLPLAAALGVAMLVPAIAQRYGEWSPPVHLGFPVNGATEDMNPILSRDGLSLYFTRTIRPVGGPPANYNYVAHRESVEAPWDLPVVLGQLGDYFVVSTDGHRAYFGRKTANGKSDLFVSRRRNKNDDAGWGPPESLGPLVNTDEYNETTPDLSPGMGVQFEALSEADIKSIRSFLRKRAPMFYAE